MFNKLALFEVVFEGERIVVEDFEGGVYRILLCRPERKNALDELMVRELEQAFKKLNKKRYLASGRVAVLEAEGGFFCAGADLSEMRKFGKCSREQNLNSTRGLARMFFAAAALKLPLIAYLQGGAFGGAVGLLSCCDLVVMEDDASLVLSEVRLGLIPAVIAPYVVRRLGVAKASELMLSGALYDATDAKELGLAHVVVPAGKRGRRALALTVNQFLQAEPRALRRTKDLIRKCMPLPSPALREHCARELASVRRSAEAIAGIEAFFKKSTPPWAPDPSLIGAK